MVVKTQEFNGFSQKESLLYGELVDESIEHYGIPLFYIQRDFNNDNLDKLHGENPLSAFTKTWEMTMDIKGLESFVSGETTNDRMGYVFGVTQALIIERRRFKQYTDETMERPRLNDIIYIPFLGKFFEITGYDDVQTEEYYTHGLAHVFTIAVSVWEYSHEIINTGNPEVDDAAVASGGRNDAGDLPTTPFIESENDVVDDLDLTKEIGQNFVDWQDSKKQN